MVVACTGFFDGVHKGHLAVLNETLSIARECGAPAHLFTFWPHPRMILHQDAAKLRLLNTLDEKISLLKRAGIDEVFVLPFSRDFAKMTSAEFFTELVDKYSVTTLVIGYDHRIGSDIWQSRAELLASAERAGITPVSMIEYRDPNGLIISSTKIREQLVAGNVREANKMLGYAYSLEGAVVEGNRIGRTIGFPTANMELYEPIKLLPANGVYMVKVECMGRTYNGITNIGTRPTVNSGSERTIETHILNFNDEIYGLYLKIYILDRIRDEITFSSLDKLKEQLQQDKIICERKINL